MSRPKDGTGRYATSVCRFQHYKGTRFSNRQQAEALYEDMQDGADSDCRTVLHHVSHRWAKRQGPDPVAHFGTIVCIPGACRSIILEPRLQEICQISQALKDLQLLTGLKHDGMTDHNTGKHIVRIVVLMRKARCGNRAKRSQNFRNPDNHTYDLQDTGPYPHAFTVPRRQDQINSPATGLDDCSPWLIHDTVKYRQER